MENDLENLNINEEVKYYNFPPPLRDIQYNENNNSNQKENKGINRPKKIFSKKNNSNTKPQSRNQKNEDNLLENMESGLTSDENIDHPKPLASDYYDEEKDDIRNSFIKMEKEEKIKEDNIKNSQLSKRKFEEENKILDLKIVKKLENSFRKSQIDDKVNGNHIKSIEVKVNIASNEPNNNLNGSQRKEKVNYIKKVKYDLKPDFPANDNQISQQINSQNKIPKEFVKNNNQQNNAVEKNTKNNEKGVIKKNNYSVNNQNRIQNINIDPEKKITNINENKNICFHICENKKININDVNKNKSQNITNQQNNGNLKKIIYNNFNNRHSKNNSNIKRKVYTHKSIEKNENSNSYSKLKQNHLSNINEYSSKRKTSCDEYISNSYYQRLSINKRNINILSNKQAIVPSNVKDTYTFQHIPNINMNSLNYINITKSVPPIESNNVVYSNIKDGKNLFPYESLKSSGNVKTQKYERGGKFNNIQTTYVVYSKNNNSICNSNRNHYSNANKSQNLKLDFQNIDDKTPIKNSTNNYYISPNQNNNYSNSYSKNNNSNDLLYRSYEYKSPYIQNQKQINRDPYYQNKANKKQNHLYLGGSLNFSGINERNTLDTIHRNYANNYLPSSKIYNSSLYYKDKNKIRPMMMNLSNDYEDINYNYNSVNNLPMNNNYISSFRYNY